MRHADILTAAGAKVPARLRAFLALLAGMEGELMDPTDRGELHPLVIPIAREKSGVVVGLLRWPTPDASMELPVVRAGTLGMTLWAGSIDQLLHAELATRDVDGEDSSGLLAAANRDEVLYQPGWVRESGLPLKAYLLMRVGGLPHLYEELALGHQEKGDTMSAAITAERSGSAAPGWARPQAFLSRLMAKQGRPEPAREAARAALTLPLWTLGMPFEEVAERAGWSSPFKADPYRILAEDESKPPLDRAAHWMDVWAIEQRPWSELRPTLSSLYREAGMEDLADFVT